MNTEQSQVNVSRLVQVTQLEASAAHLEEVEFIFLYFIARRDSNMPIRYDPVYAQNINA